jgi:2-amino-4-hydroxy-6-hydroxymethyldihydropteridine diphosphokinase
LSGRGSNNVQRVILGLGSNIKPHAHLTQAVQMLREHFPSLELSPIYETQAVGFSGANFWNMVAGIKTDMSLDTIKTLLRGMEVDIGRPQQAQKWVDRCIDIDILTFGNFIGISVAGHLPRADILRYAHVLAPLADLYPDECHAQTGRSFADHWQHFAGDKTGNYRRINNALLGP